MFNSVALDVVIGLVFIYLLYSLLGTVLSEMIATLLGLRARNLKEAIGRMLTDDRAPGRLRRILNSLNVMKSNDSKVVDTLYKTAEIKYLGGGGLYRNPSSIKPESFSKALVEVLIGDKKIKALKAGVLEPESAGYVQELWEEAQGDIEKFRLLLENWFNRTMEKASEWYKRKIQLILLVMGFCMAWVFYADTFVIVKSLSNDKKAREQMVSLANAYVQSGIAAKDSSLIEIKKKLDADIANANVILGLGGWLPDKVLVVSDTQTGEKCYTPPLDSGALSLAHQKIASGTLSFSLGDKLGYLFRLGGRHFFGFLITAMAISLGAPFWFDLLNKMMKLRTAPKVKSEKN